MAWNCEQNHNCWQCAVTAALGSLASIEPNWRKQLIRAWYMSLKSTRITFCVLWTLLKMYLVTDGATIGRTWSFFNEWSLSASTYWYDEPRKIRILSCTTISSSIEKCSSQGHNIRAISLTATKSSRTENLQRCEYSNHLEYAVIHHSNHIHLPRVLLVASSIAHLKHLNGTRNFHCRRCIRGQQKDEQSKSTQAWYFGRKKWTAIGEASQLQYLDWEILLNEAFSADMC